MTDIILNDDQAKTILVEALNRGLYESLNNEVPQDSAQRMKDAEDLVSAANAAFNNGNRSDNVQTILFISDVDQKPLPIKEQQIAKAIANNDKNGSDESNFHNGIDLATLSDGVIEGLIIGLDKYPPSEQVEEDRKAYLAEKERRENEKVGKDQDEPQSTTAQENGEKAGEAAPEGSFASVEERNQTDEESRSGEPADNESSFDSSGGTDPAQGEDAGAFARAQTPETSPEGKQAKAKAPKEDGSRVELEEQLTLPIIKAHGVDVSRLESIPIDKIQYMIENPDGPGDKKVPITDSEAEAAAVTNKEVKAVQGIAADNPSPERVISKEDLGIEVEKTTAPKATKEIDREYLEAQITGPTLKAYGQGRKSVPNIGINELRFMVEHPDGKVDPAELEAARSVDKLGQKIVDVVRETDKEEIVIKGPPVEEVQEPKIKTKKWSDVRPEDISNEVGENHAQEIIAQEGFPIPPTYSDEQAPEFPMDMSKCSRDELYSFHAQFHAYETRINYILIEHEDRLNDWAHKRNYREAAVAKSVPFMGEDGKRNTNEYRDVQVKGDEKVLELSNKEHESKKIVNDLKALQKNFHLSCERLSRQMSKYETERLDAPR